MTKREARKQKWEWNVALVEKRILKIGGHTFRVYASADEAEKALSAILADGYPASLVDPNA